MHVETRRTHRVPDTHVGGAKFARPRAWLRARPRAQGLVLAPFGVPHRLPDTVTAIYPLLYHGVAAGQLPGIRHQLLRLKAQGAFVSLDACLTSLSTPDPQAGPRFCLTFDDGHKEWLHHVLPLLHELRIPATFFITTNRVVTGASETRLTWADCRALRDAGMHLGSHSTSHRRLSLLDPLSARREIRDSRDEIEHRLGIPILDFAAPFGLPGVDYGAREIDLLVSAGYRSCVSAAPGRVVPGDSPFHVARCGLNPSWPMLAVRKRVHE